MLNKQRRAGYLQYPIQDVPQPQQDSSREQESVESQVEAIRAEVRRQIETDPERIRRQQEHEQERQEGYPEYAMTQIFNTAVPGHGYPIRNRASEQVILGLLNPG